MTTREAIALLAKKLRDELVICTTGYTCRDMQAVSDRPENFYMIGSMGLAASIGLGVALCRPRRKVVVLDGDGSLLMGLGALTMVGSLKPKNFIHVVLDNEAFVSTGSQPTYSRSVSLERVAASCGYPATKKVVKEEELERVFEEFSQKEGPHLLLVKCQPDSGGASERVRLSPEAVASRFQKAVSTNGGAG